ncbi:MAG: DNA primase [Victivallales bacterium]|nr:DNA primase [Victivallales bacterium]
MGFISQETIDQVYDKADIVEVVSGFTEVHRRGKEYWCCCPFHHEKTPSCKLNQERQGYYCFGCKEHGNIITFVKKIVNTDFPGAIRWLADKYNIQVIEEQHGRDSAEAERLRKLSEKRRSLLNDIANWYHSQLNTQEAEAARNYLASRGLDANAIEQFKLGYSPNGWDNAIRWAAGFGYDMEDLKATGLVSENEEKQRLYDRFRGRLMFPIWNELGKVVGFSARILEQDAKAAKYVNSPETEFFQKGQLLYALNFARPNLKEMGYALICEGQLDVISCHRAGLVNAVAAQGTAFTEQHAKLLHKSIDKVVLSFDADTAGYKAAERTITILHAAEFNVSVVTLPAGEDPDSIFRKGGPEALRQVMSVTEPAIPYLFRISCEQIDFNSPDGKSQIVHRVLAAVQVIKDEITRTAHCQWLAEKMNLPENLIFSTLHALMNKAEEHNAVPVWRPRTRESSSTPPPFPFAPGIPSATLQNPNAAGYTPPPFVQNNMALQTWNALFDIVLHDEQMAQRLALQQDILDGVPQNAIGMAINQVIIMVMQEEWNKCIQVISDMDIFNDPDVGRAIMASQYANLAAGQPTNDSSSAENNADNKMETAFNDCIFKIRRQLIEESIAQKQSQMATEPDAEKRRDLQAELARLIMKKTRLKNERTTTG